MYLLERSCYLQSSRKVSRCARSTLVNFALPCLAFVVQMVGPLSNLGFQA